MSPILTKTYLKPIFGQHSSHAATCIIIFPFKTEGDKFMISYGYS